MVLVVAGHFILGFILASLLNREFKGRTFFRVIFMLPWFFPEAVVALLFTWIMNPMYGILNSILRGLGLISTNLSWLGSNSFAFPSVVFVCIWKGFPLIMTLILADCKVFLKIIMKQQNWMAQEDGSSFSILRCRV